MKGKVNGAVETCGESFHRFDRYLNFSNPVIVKNFDPHACGWAFGMNVFDLVEWRRQNITKIYHSWQKLVSFTYLNTFILLNRDPLSILSVELKLNCTLGRSLELALGQI
jgi:hypothetical protein